MLSTNTCSIFESYIWNLYVTICSLENERRQRSLLMPPESITINIKKCWYECNKILHIYTGKCNSRRIKNIIMIYTLFIVTGIDKNILMYDYDFRIFKDKLLEITPAEKCTFILNSFVVFMLLVEQSETLNDNSFMRRGTWKGP